MQQLLRMLHLVCITLIAIGAGQLVAMQPANNNKLTQQDLATAREIFNRFSDTQDVSLQDFIYFQRITAELVRLLGQRQDFAPGREEYNSPAEQNFFSRSIAAAYDEWAFWPTVIDAMQEQLQPEPAPEQTDELRREHEQQMQELREQHRTVMAQAMTMIKSRVAHHAEEKAGLAATIAQLRQARDEQATTIAQLQQQITRQAAELRRTGTELERMRAAAVAMPQQNTVKCSIAAHAQFDQLMQDNGRLRQQLEQQAAALTESTAQVTRLTQQLEEQQRALASKQRPAVTNNDHLLPPGARPGQVPPPPPPPAGPKLKHAVSSPGMGEVHNNAVLQEMRAPSDDMRANLMAQIKNQKFTLKKAEPTTPAQPQKSNAAASSAGSAADNGLAKIAAALAARRSHEGCCCSNATAKHSQVFNCCSRTI
ncbi:hypothetical protein M1466_03805 [Candidatus Dependentiae bacterium]|nr:hypothetical protein [Candidatus Dependentiae bacterium]